MISDCEEYSLVQREADVRSITRGINHLGCYSDNSVQHDQNEGKEILIVMNNCWFAKVGV